MTNTHFWFIFQLSFIFCLTTDIDTTQIDPHGIMDNSFPNTVRTSHDVFLTRLREQVEYFAVIPYFQDYTWIVKHRHFYVCLYTWFVSCLLHVTSQKLHFERCFDNVLTTDLWHRHIHTGLTVPLTLKTFNSQTVDTLLYLTEGLKKA